VVTGPKEEIKVVSFQKKTAQRKREENWREVVCTKQIPGWGLEGRSGRIVAGIGE